MKILRWLLFPFSQLNVLVMAIRNFMFDIGFLEQAEYPVPVISVGNLSTGGTGKTPFVEALIDMIPTNKKIAVLSRGYGRRTKGYLKANDSSTAADIGDEPYQLYRKYGKRITVAVVEKRRIGMEELLNLPDPPGLVILDDAYQHRYVKRDLNILLTTYDEPFFKDLSLPTGNLRETRFEAKRADIVVVTKCPMLSTEDKRIWQERVKRFAGDVLVVFSSITYSEAQSAFDENQLTDKEVALLTGIADPKPLKAYLDQKLKIKHYFKFGDHHNFDRKELDLINVKLSEKNTPILTTEKDMVRLLAYKDHELFNQHSLYFIPIQTSIDGKERLKEQVLKLFS